MIRSVLWYLLFALIALLILVWFLEGGVGKVESAANDFKWNNFSVLGFFGEGGSWLPWAVPIPQGPDISGLTGTTMSGASQAESFGNNSPYQGVTLSAPGATASDPQLEYLVIQNESGQTLDLSGWSLQSAQSGARAYIPLGASFFQMGALNPLTDIELQQDGVAIVTTGESPVGISFQENECSGYLQQLQNYSPPIETECPAPSEYAQQAAQYGQSCADYISSLPTCTLPLQIPSGISAQCAAYVQAALSYNGCVQSNENSPSFALGNWRIYLGGTRELWNNEHDTIRLLDSHGEVVAVTSY